MDLDAWMPGVTKNYGSHMTTSSVERKIGFWTKFISAVAVMVISQQIIFPNARKVKQAMKTFHAVFLIRKEKLFCYENNFSVLFWHIIWI